MITCAEGLGLLRTDFYLLPEETHWNLLYPRYSIGICPSESTIPKKVYWNLSIGIFLSESTIPEKLHRIIW